MQEVSPGARRVREAGQACVEFVALVAAMCVVFGAVVALSPAPDGRVVGGFLARHFTCAMSGRCAEEEGALTAAYGAQDAALVRELAPNLAYEPGERQLPVDWRACRRPQCAQAPDDPQLDAHLTDAGRRTTAFTRLVRRGGRLYVTYWLYYPDSNTAVAGSDRLWERSWLLPRIRALVAGTPDYPGYHRDDWEAVMVRVDPDGSVWTRASSHGGFQGCKWSQCADEWVRRTGWVRVSRGSHSGHVPFRMEPMAPEPGAPSFPRYVPTPAERPHRRVPVAPGRGLRERSTSGEGLRLIPLETHDRSGYRPLDPGVRPPWRKRAYDDPETDES